MNKEDLLKDMADLWTNFLQVRATYPSVNLTHVGQTSIKSPSYYEDRGLNFSILLEKPLIREDIERWNRIANWINQSVIIRLYALLDYYDIVSETTKINTNLDGHDEVEILRRLRHHFAHTGQYNQTEKKQKKLFDRIVNHFKLEINDTGNLPIPIDNVVEVIFKKTKRYIEQI